MSLTEYSEMISSFLAASSCSDNSFTDGFTTLCVDVMLWFYVIELAFSTKFFWPSAFSFRPGFA